MANCLEETIRMFNFVCVENNLQIWKFQNQRALDKDRNKLTIVQQDRDKTVSDMCQVC